MQKTLKGVLAALFVVILWVGSLVASSSPIVIESAESKNAQMQPVFNEIRFFPGWKKDIWMMNQSHHGRTAGIDQWDRLAIVIDKTTSPSTAKFYQLSDGPLVWDENLPKKSIEFSVSCMICHNNGPRAIRPTFESKDAPLGIQEKARIFAWNLRIKTYGRIHYDQTHDDTDKVLEIPFRHKTAEAMKELTVNTCTLCHKESGLFARGALLRQQMSTIESLVARGEMPPPGFSLSEKEKRELQDFIRGF